MGTRKNTLVTLLAALALGCASSSGSTDDEATGDGGDDVMGEDPDAEFEIGEDDLIDDFEDNNDGIETLDGRTGSWYTFRDESTTGEMTPGEAKFTPSAGGANDSKHAGTIKGKGFTIWGAGMGVDLNYDGSFEAGVGMPKGVFSAAGHEGITFLAKGNSKFRFSVVTRKVLLEKNGGTCVAADDAPDAQLCDNGHGVFLTATSEWKRFKVKLSDLKQDEGWGQVIAFDEKSIVGLQFQVGPSVTFDLSVDDVAFY